MRPHALIPDVLIGVLIVGALVALGACAKPRTDADNALNSAQAEANAQQRAWNSPEAKAGANMAEAPLANPAPASNTP